jgi:NTP pyrophosphatase (non-canonical NTP hydrolase)
MAEFSTELTPAQIERLAVLMEECAEVQQVIGKILRHGLFSRHPMGGPPNVDLLETELGDVVAAMRLLHAGDDIDIDMVNDHAPLKLFKLRKYTHFQSDAIFAFAESL